ncbi:hypothetical protein EJ05DRAFT_489381 [Pseudovirgaria hyperparasitica]|uniref:Zn(2)-C6 fungal-type domain-containing protein n=1 Tax=Pseudovirgaria hyperparasitica TaxID=470096 RepID=A0A6A6VW89_9PEZI|nr:uncharacterized protein EJ05DRAFT_489381 [Pseudovirgaria hyperparasitica]KAF2754119.1 hypothetical protein EJ05DRAFT_489381 [Pseudovirgaria hyperparasitica]
MSTAVAIQSSAHRPSPVAIPANRPRPPTKRSSPSGKENIPHGKSKSQSAANYKSDGNNARARRERPCDACRRRKSRCVIHEGQILCVLCEFHKQDCTFVQDPQPRKRKVPTDAKEETAKKRSSEIYSPALVSHTPTITPTITRTSPPVAPSPILLTTSARDTTALGETLGLQRRQHSKYIGLTTAFDPLLIGLTKFDNRNESTFDLGTLRKVNDHECFIMLPDDSTQQYGHDMDTLNQIEQIVAPHGPALLDIFFRIVHPSFPIIQKELLLERYRNGDRSFSPPLMAGIYILALNWWSHDPSLAQYVKPDASLLEPIATRSLTAAMERPKLSTVQAGLLLLQRPGADSWSLTTQLVAIGQELGLHLDCANWSIPAWERGLRKRIAWALYMQDKWSSLIHGRPSHIFSANWAVRPITTEDFYEQSGTAAQTLDESPEADQGRAIYSEMIALTGIMAEVMDTFYTQVAIADFAAAGRNSTRLILDRAKPVQIRLKEWFAKLPACTRMDAPVPSPSSSSSSSSSSSPSSVSPAGFLHLAYFATEITLHRRIIQSLPTTPDPYLTYICRSAAKTRLISAMDFVNRLKPAHLRAFWHFAAAINFTLIGTFGALLQATAPAREEEAFYNLRLREYRWTLTVSAQRADWLGFAVRMLDASRHMLRGVAEKPAVAEVSSVGVPGRAEGLARGVGGGGGAGVDDADGKSSHDRDRDVEMRDVDGALRRLDASSSSSASSAAVSRAGPSVSFAGFSNEDLYAVPARRGGPGGTMRGMLGHGGEEGDEGGEEEDDDEDEGEGEGEGEE